MPATIHQEIVISASAQRIYDALLTSDQFSAFTGGRKAQIDRTPGGAFSCFDGMIAGRIVELIEGRRIVQAWRVGNWPDGIYSVARFELEPQGSGTRITFDQAGYPAEAREHLEAGWHKMYWEPLRAYLT